MICERVVWPTLEARSAAVFFCASFKNESHFLPKLPFPVHITLYGHIHVMS